MLIGHPLTTYLYESGYNGIDNMYEYWCDHRHDLTSQYVMKNRGKVAEETFESFEYKIRWASIFGLTIRLEMERLLRNHDETVNFQSLRVRYGRKYLSLKDFSDMTLSPYLLGESVDLRGLSLIKKAFIRCRISKVDFSFACLDRGIFKGVTFSQCIFYKTTFKHAIIEDCCFEEDCVIDQVDLTGGYITGEFLCEIKAPIIQYMPLYRRISSTQRSKACYSNYTRIYSHSFGDKVNDERTKVYIEDLMERNKQ